MSTARVQTSFRNKKSAKRTYAPTTAELNEAIEDYLHEVRLHVCAQVPANIGLFLILSSCFVVILVVLVIVVSTPKLVRIRCAHP